jgi:hypothetical protein
MMKLQDFDGTYDTSNRNQFQLHSNVFVLSKSLGIPNNINSISSRSDGRNAKTFGYAKATPQPLLSIHPTKYIPPKHIRRPCNLVMDGK